MKRYLGPTPDISKLPINYEPVDCEFTDDLEHLSVLKSQVEVSYWDNSKRRQKVKGVILDIFTTAQKEEFLKMNNDVLIRLDKIIEIIEITTEKT